MVQIQGSGLRMKINNFRVKDYRLKVEDKGLRVKG
jgi:hypothetical protein